MTDEGSLTSRWPSPGAGSKIARLARMMESLRGVGGVIAVRSLGLLTVLYDEGRTDP